MPFRDDREAMRARVVELEQELTALRDAQARNRVLEERTQELEQQLAEAREREEALTKAVQEQPPAVRGATSTASTRKRDLRILAALIVLVPSVMWIASSCQACR